MTEDGGRFARVVMRGGESIVVVNGVDFPPDANHQEGVDFLNSAHEKAVADAREEGRRAGLEEAAMIAEVTDATSDMSRYGPHGASAITAQNIADKLRSLLKNKSQCG